MLINSNDGVTRITSSASATDSITCYFYVRKLRFLRKVRKSMSLKMILNSHNSLFAHIFFSSHFIRCQRLKEQCASSYGLPANTFSYLLKKSAEILFQYPLSLKINTPFLITQHGGSDACGGMAEKFPPFPPLSPHVIFISHEFLRFSVFSRIVQCEEELAIAKKGASKL